MLHLLDQVEHLENRVLLALSEPFNVAFVIDFRPSLFIECLLLGSCELSNLFNALDDFFGLEDPTNAPAR